MNEEMLKKIKEAYEQSKYEWEQRPDHYNWGRYEGAKAIYDLVKQYYDF